MKQLMLAMQFVSLIAKLLTSDQGKAILDNFIDAIEFMADPGGRTESICKTIRLMLNVPDDDEINEV